MLTRFLFSPGKSLLVRASSPHPLSSPSPPPPAEPNSDFPPSLANSLLYPELHTFHVLLSSLEGKSSGNFQVFQGPIRLRHKLLTRALLLSCSSEGQSHVDLSSVKGHLIGGFHSDFKALLQEQGFSHQSETSQFVESLRDRFEALNDKFHSTEKNFWSLVICFQFMMHSIIWGGLFYTTYFWKDWEVVEPISYLLAVGFNFIYLWCLIYSGRVSGSQISILKSSRNSKLLKKKLNYSLNRKRFETFYYEYNELLRNLN